MLKSEMQKHNSCAGDGVTFRVSCNEEFFKLYETYGSNNMQDSEMDVAFHSVPDFCAWYSNNDWEDFITLEVRGLNFSCTYHEDFNGETFDIKGNVRMLRRSLKWLSRYSNFINNHLNKSPSELRRMATK